MLFSKSPLEAGDDSDIELRSSEGSIVPFLNLEGIGETTLRLEHADRWRDDLDDYFYEHNQVSVRIPIPSIEGLSWDAGYRRRTGDVGGQNRFLLNLNWSKKEIGGTPWTFRVRSQWELRDNDGIPHNHYKSRLRFLMLRDIPCLTIVDRPWQFAVEDEVFYDLSDGRFDENRLGAGIKIPITEHLSFRASAEWQRLDQVSSRGSDEDNFLISLVLQYRLPKRKPPEGRTVDLELDEEMHDEF